MWRLISAVVESAFNGCLQLGRKRANAAWGRATLQLKKVKVHPEQFPETGLNDPARIARRVAAQHGIAPNQVTHVARRSSSSESGCSHHQVNKRTERVETR